MKTKFRGLALTAILLSGTSMTFADQGSNSAVGDLPGYGEDAYFDEEAAYAQSNYVAPTPSHPVSPAMGYTTSRSPHYAPIAFSDLQPASFRTASRLQTVGASSYGASCYGASCGGCSSCSGGCSGCDSGSCDGGCDSAWGLRKGKLCCIFDRCGSDTWAQFEFLTWFTQDRDMPALVTTSAPTTLPVLPEGGADNVAVVFGDPINGEVSGGVRADYGKYVTDNVGIGGRLWILNESNDSYFASGDGSDQSIGRPFFNSNTGAEDALLIALDGVFTGGVAAQSTLDIMAAEAYSRIRFSCSKCCRLDFIGGYSYFDIEDTLAITSTTITNATARTRIYNDFFEAENRFNGGQLGFEMVITRGRWMARSLTKVHLGNMAQNIRIAGNSSDQTPPGAATLTSGGLLALGNQGVYERDLFAFAPEANFKLAYCFRKNVRLSVGYSFIYWDNVALTGDVVDRVIDGSTLNTGVFAAQPAFAFNDSSLWVQGLDLGVVVDF